MAPPTSPDADPLFPAPLDDGFLDLIESIREPALVFLSGGRIVAVNRAMARLPGPPAVGETMEELLERCRARRADGSAIAHGDLPHTRALRGEIVHQGERFALTLRDGTVHWIVVTSTPVVVDGTVVAGLSVWHDFSAFVRDLAGRS
ncbi:MAG: PAS domain S-box protein [Methanospirillum sp.]|nr:PAS domain S-box protein [Methanospirillum sp.]